MKKIEVCFSCDDNYSKYATAAILSILDNKNSDEEYIFHILHANLSQEVVEKFNKIQNVKLHQVQNEIFEPYFNNGVCKNVTIPTLYRLILPSLLPDVDRILYLDCDIAILKSLAKLYEIDLKPNQYAAAVHDLGYEGHMERMGFEQNDNNFYFNAGVILFDLNKMRADNIQDKLFDYLKNNYQKLSYSDQDVLNAVLLGRVCPLDKEFNFITPNFYFNNKRDITIAHFAGMKPWSIGFYNPYRAIFWKYLLMAGGSKLHYRKIMLWHNKFFQILLFLKFYPFFFTKKVHRDDFFKIVFGYSY